MENIYMIYFLMYFGVFGILASIIAITVMKAMRGQQSQIPAICLIVSFLISVIGAYLYGGTDEYKMNMEQKTTEQDTEKSEEETTKDTEIEEKTIKEIDLAKELNEIDFKNLCSEIFYNDIDENSIGKYVYKDLFNWDKKDNEIYLCSAVEDFLEEIKGYQKTYRIYKIIDCRFDKTFPIENSDIIRVYGIVDGVSKSYFTGGYSPTIKVYYIEYIRKYGKEAQDKTMEEIKQERIEESQRIQEELEYKNSLNTDYDGKTKNIDGMNDLKLEDYISHCDKMNYNNLKSKENLTGRYVSIHVQLFKHKIFKNDKAKENAMSEWIDPDLINDHAWKIELYSERAEDYIPDFGILYFQNTENIYPDKMKTGQNIVIYGQIINQPQKSYEDWKIIVRYYEFE